MKNNREAIPCSLSLSTNDDDDDDDYGKQRQQLDTALQFQCDVCVCSRVQPPLRMCSYSQVTLNRNNVQPKATKRQQQRKRGKGRKTTATAAAATAQKQQTQRWNKYCNKIGIPNRNKSDARGEETVRRQISIHIPNSCSSTHLVPLYHHAKWLKLLVFQYSIGSVASFLCLRKKRRKTVTFRRQLRFFLWLPNDGVTTPAHREQAMMRMENREWE